MDLILIAWIRVEVGCLQAESEQICFEVWTTFIFFQTKPSSTFSCFKKGLISFSSYVAGKENTDIYFFLGTAISGLLYVLI